MNDPTGHLPVNQRTFSLPSGGTAASSYEVFENGSLSLGEHPGDTGFGPGFDSWFGLAALACATFGYSDADATQGDGQVMSASNEVGAETTYKGTNYWVHQSEEPYYPFFSPWKKVSSVDLPIPFINMLPDLYVSVPIFMRNLFVSFAVKQWLTLPGSPVLIPGTSTVTVDKFYVVANQLRVGNATPSTWWVKPTVSGYNMKAQLGPHLDLVPTIPSVPHNLPLANPWNALP